jgi:NhaP-type Na+/H+ or K+/H+ antiporter
VKMRGERSAMTLPASMGLLEPVQSTSREWHSWEAVTSQVMTAHVGPRGGVSVPAHLFCPAHISVNVAGITAEEMITPITT